MDNGSLEEQLRQLTDPELIFREYGRLMESHLRDIQSVEDAYNHGESPAIGGILDGYMSKYSKDTDKYLQRLPIVLGMLQTSFTELIVQNNRRIIELMNATIASQSGKDI
jgi:hypothetical protein